MWAGWIGADRFLRVKDDELPAGTSGAPLLDRRRGVVCGVLKTSRELDSPYGGLAIPASKVRETFAGVWQENQDYCGMDVTWRKLRTAAWHAAAPDDLMNPAELGLLHEVWDMLQRDPDNPFNLNWLYGQIMGELGRPADGLTT